MPRAKAKGEGENEEDEMPQRLTRFNCRKSEWLLTRTQDGTPTDAMLDFWGEQSIW
jgi:hypothetical protein